MREKHGDIILTLLDRSILLHLYRCRTKGNQNKKEMSWLVLDICDYLDGEGVRREGAG